MTDSTRLLILRWFDKGVLGAIGLLALVSLGAAFTGDAELAEEATQIASLTEKLEKLQTLQTLEPPPALALADEVEKQVGVDHVPHIRRWPPWSMHRRPYLITAFTEVTDGPRPIHESPDLQEPVAERGQVSLRWQQNPLDRLIDVKGYEVHRAESAEGPWMMIGEGTLADPTHVDRTVKARTPYFYKVISVAVEDRLHPRKPQSLPEDERIRESAVRGPISTPREMVIDPQQVVVPDPVKQPDAKTHARVVVHVWDRDGRAFVRMGSFYIAVGDEIGDKEAKIGPGGVTARRTTGLTLVDAGEEQRQRERHGLKVSFAYRFIVVRHPDGTTERFDNVDLPEELGR